MTRAAAWLQRKVPLRFSPDHLVPEGHGIVEHGRCRVRNAVRADEHVEAPQPCDHEVDEPADGFLAGRVEAPGGDVAERSERPDRLLELGLGVARRPRRRRRPRAGSAPPRARFLSPARHEGDLPFETHTRVHLSRRAEPGAAALSNGLRSGVGLPTFDSLCYMIDDKRHTSTTVST